MKQGAKCPECGETFSKLKNWACPHCKTPLTLVQEKEGQRTKNRYVLTNKPKEEVKPTEVDHFIYGSINIIQTGERAWEVYIALLVQTLFCPNCRRAALWYPDIKKGSLSHKCEKCKHITEYYFRL